MMKFFYLLLVLYKNAIVCLHQHGRISHKKPINEISSNTIVFNGIFPIHKKGNKSKRCSKKINVVRGIRRMEAMLYAIDLINNNHNILQNLHIKFEVHDSCDQSSVALENIVSTIIQNTNSSNNDLCTNTGDNNETSKKVFGFIGASRSAVSKQVANLLRLFRIPQISYASTSSELNDRKRYKYFLRSVPSDITESQAIIDLCIHFNWKSIAVIYSTGSFGESAYESLISEGHAKNVCIVGSFKLTRKTNYADIFDILAKEPQTKTVVLLCLFTEVKKLLQAAISRNQTYTWITKDVWGYQTKYLNTEPLQNKANGSLILSLHSSKINESFTRYFSKLTPQNNNRNPWFQEYWQQQVRKHACMDSLECMFSLQSRRIYDDKIPYVIDAVYALANSIDVLYKEKCPLQQGICKSFLKTDGAEILEQLLQTQFKGVFGLTKFDSSGSAGHGYDIMYYKNNHLIKLGEWNINLTIQENSVQFEDSYCAKPCVPGQVRTTRMNSPTCCYDCSQCRENEIAGKCICSVDLSMKIFSKPLYFNNIQSRF